MKQNNCNDCAFQCDSWIDLKKHTKITRNKPRDQTETCYNCNQEFSSYKQLMNHRKLEHTSKKQECVFDEDSCWYVHKKENADRNEEVFCKCDDCESNFTHTSELMRHKRKCMKIKFPNVNIFYKGHVKETMLLAVFCTKMKTAEKSMKIWMKK